ncbi:hypothetical protein WEI85_45645 [Actinomycetes bacterium KLBMP 9797]
MHFQPVPLPTGEPAAVLDGVARWITSAPLQELVAGFGGRWPTGDSPTLLAWLDAFSAQHWDFRATGARPSGARSNGARGVVERPDAPEPALAPAVATLVTEAATALGMVTARPPRHREYQHLIVLGGLAHACLRRTAYAAHLVRRGTAVHAMGVLGSYRQLTPAELTLPAARGCATEVDALDLGVRRAFGLDCPAEAAPSVRTYLPPDGPPIIVLAAPSSDPDHRADTADTQRFWARHAGLAKGDRVLVVTSPIYVPFQHCDAIRTLGLPYGCLVDTVGVDPRTTDDDLPEPTLTPGRYLQEIRSAIRAMRILVASLDGPTPPMIKASLT